MPRRTSYNLSPAEHSQIHAYHTQCWIDQSGPRYIATRAFLVDQDGDFVRLSCPQAATGKYGRSSLSYVSWLKCQQASLGDELDLLVRV